MSLPESVKLVEVGPRDGLQNISVPIATDDKVRYIDLLTQCGFPEIEVTSFVSPRRIPQLADAQNVSRSINLDSNIMYTALVPNLRGLHNAIHSNYSSIAVFTAASNTFSQKNTQCTMDESIQRFHKMKHVWEDHGLRIRGYISTVWHCPYEGSIPVNAVSEVIAKLLDLGIQEISLGDTIGKATTEEVRYTLESILKKWEPSYFALHMHDTFGMAAANIKAGMEFDISTFDSSAGGMGGCPYAEGATGNIASEKVVALCESLGIETGINKSKLDEASNLIQSIVAKESLTHAEN